jgi:hypothetical protein
MKQLTRNVTRRLEAEKPRTVLFLSYVDVERGVASFLHAFPDTDAMDVHVEGADERSSRACELIEPLGCEIYGGPSDTALGNMRRDLRRHLLTKATPQTGVDGFPGVRRHGSRGRPIKSAIFGTVTATILFMAACAPAAPSTTPTASPAASATPSSTPSDSGPTDAVTSAFRRAQAGGVLRQLDFLACVAGGADATQFSVLFGTLTELALATSGIDPDEYWRSLGASWPEFEATEISRSGEQAQVSVRLKMAIDPDIVKLREMMRASLQERGRPVDEAAIDAVIDSLVGDIASDQVVENDVTVVRRDGIWRACEAGS